MTTASGNGYASPLLVKHDFGSANYTVYLTDLTFLWTTSSDRRQIIKQALNSNTSIDPSEDASQMQLLLRHIKGSLEGGEGTVVTVHGEDKSDKMTLDASITLPSPLPPLEWSLHLAKASQATFTSYFVLPILNQFSFARTQVKSLMQQLREKDHIIDRLIDRMQTDGTDLGKVFPGIQTSRNGSKLNSRESAAKSVKGLAEFDQKIWLQGCASNHKGINSVDDMLASVLEGDAIDSPGFSQSSADRARFDSLAIADKPLNNTPQSTGLNRSKKYTHREASIDDFQVRRNQAL